MRYLRRLVCSLSLLASATFAVALDLPVRNIGGKPYYYYTVDKKDKFYELPDKIGAPRSVIVRYNPAVTDGLQPGMVIIIPLEYDAKIINGYYTVKYEPGKGESIYGIGNKFDIPVDRIIEFNPAATHGIKGETLILPVALAPSEEMQATGSLLDGTPYTVSAGETLQTIALNNNVPVDEIVAVNPRLEPSGVKEGTIIIIPERKSYNNEMHAPEVEKQEVTAPADNEEPVGQEPYEVPRDTEIPVEDPQPPVTDIDMEEGPSVVSLLLPFALDSDGSSKGTQLITEFYKGFLMGIEQLSHSGSPIIVKAFDSAVEADSLATILESEDLRSSDIIIAPDTEDVFKRLCASAEGSNAVIFNPFVVRNEDYLTNPLIMQAIIPHQRMYAKAVDAFMENLGAKIPVFLSRIQGQADKTPFITLLKERLDSDSIAYREIAYRDFLSAEDLADLPYESDYVFIPASGNRIEFNKLAPALKTFRETGAQVSLFGFPEWITFRNETLESMHALDATIYSRFNVVPNDVATKGLERQFRQWYGTDMMDAIPNQGVFGYDIASFVIRTLRNGRTAGGSLDPVPYQGIESGFNMISSGESGGTVNDNLYLLNFRPDGTTVKKIL